MPAEALIASLGIFEQFSQLPNELKSQVWSYVHQPRRVLQIYYDPKLLSWKVCKDSLKPDPVSQIHQLARDNYRTFLGVSILPKRDIILFSDPKFTLRPIQDAFLSTDNVRQLQHVSFTVSIWQGLRHTHHEFPTCTLSPAGFLRKLPALKDFYLAVSGDDEAEFETYDYGYEGEWNEDDDLGFVDGLRRVALAMDGEWDSDEEVVLDRRAQFRAGAWSEPKGILSTVQTLPPLERDESRKLTTAGKADHFLRCLEESSFTEMMKKTYKRKTGALRLSSIYSSDEPFAEDAPHFRSDIEMVFGRETSSNTDWEPPAIHIRELEGGEMTLEDGEDTDGWEDMDGEDVDGDDANSEEVDTEEMGLFDSNLA